MLRKLTIGIFIALLLPIMTLAADQPDYQGGVLTVPRIDTPEQVGQYQYASLRLGQDGRWQLESLRTLDYNGGLFKVPVYSVESVVTTSFPVGAYLHHFRSQGHQA